MVDLAARKAALQLELAQLQALAAQLDRQREDIRVRALQVTGQILLLDELIADAAAPSSTPSAVAPAESPISE